ncbi:hypothetical protein B4Q13_15015, partial [Lacticaseibacillus rhamnosus]
MDLRRAPAHPDPPRAPSRLRPPCLTPASAMGVEDYARTYIGLDDQGRLADADYRGRLVRHRMDSQAFQLTLRRAADEARSNQGPSNAAAIM